MERATIGGMSNQLVATAALSIAFSAGVSYLMATELPIRPDYRTDRLTELETRINLLAESQSRMTARILDLETKIVSVDVLNDKMGSIGLDQHWWCGVGGQIDICTRDVGKCMGLSPSPCVTRAIAYCQIGNAASLFCYKQLPECEQRAASAPCVGVE